MDAPGPNMMLRWVGDRNLRVSVGGAAPQAGVIERVRTVPGVVDVAPAEETALVTFDGLTLEPDAAMAEVRRALGAVGTEVAGVASRLVEVPVCYSPSCGPDLGDVARRSGLSVERVVELHCGAEHVVRFLGFAPGFAYIAGLPPALAMPRLDSPRVRVPAGSVGIAGDRTGIYPREGPGGWRLIGRTPLRMFDAEREPAALLRAGDRVRCVPIGEDEYRGLGGR